MLGLRVAVSSRAPAVAGSRLSRLVAAPRKFTLGQRRHVVVAAAPVEETAPSTATPLTEASVASLTVWALTALPAAAADLPAGGPPAQSYYVSLGLFLMTLPGVCCRRPQIAPLCIPILLLTRVHLFSKACGL